MPFKYNMTRKARRKAGPRSFSAPISHLKPLDKEFQLLITLRIMNGLSILKRISKGDVCARRMKSASHEYVA